MSKISEIINRKLLPLINLQVHRNNPRSFDMQLKGKNLIGAEIGVLDGEHAKYILDNYDIKKLYLIDPYTSRTDFNVKGEIFDGEDPERLIKAQKNAKKILAKYEHKIVWLIDLSENVFNKIKEELDFVYIDAAHDYENVTKDISNYYPLVKTGGLFGGHDIDNGTCECHRGLTKAVLEFINKTKHELFIGSNNWWIIK